MPKADEIWLAVIGPDTPAAGEMKSVGQIYQNQVAQTVASFLNVSYKSNMKAGEKVSSAFK